MQNVAALDLSTTHLRAAFLLTKDEAAALLSACGPKRKTTRSDERVVWLDWRRGELIAQDRTLLARLYDPRVVTDVAPAVVHADALKSVATTAKAKDLIVVGLTGVDGVVALGIIEARDVEPHGDAVTPKAGTGITFHEAPPDLVLTHDKLQALVPGVDPAEPGDRTTAFVWDSRFTDVLHRVAKATGKGQALTVLPPESTGAPFLVVVEAGATLDSANRWDVVGMPLVPARGG